MRVSVILSTYNAPDWLEKAIWGYACQSYQDFELLIADDGSTEETAARTECLRRETGLAIRHLWQEHRGFRKCTILNKAIAASSTDYLVFSDGDCIPRWDFLATHVSLAEKRCFLSGGAVRLPMALSRLISKEDILARRVTDAKWLLASGLGKNPRLRMLTWRAWLARFWDAVTTTQATWNGCNVSAWKVDVVRANGYDERMEYGGLDRELGERLVNAGLRGKQVRHRAICIHLDHPRAYVRQEALAYNRAVRKDTRQNRIAWTPYGIEQPLKLAEVGEAFEQGGQESEPRRAAA